MSVTDGEQREDELVADGDDLLRRGMRHARQRRRPAPRAAPARENTGRMSGANHGASTDHHRRPSPDVREDERQ